ncbi:MAG: AAA family ATPase [Treponema sp.]|nr:AAA family ATPase [Treponema sp.]
MNNSSITYTKDEPYAICFYLYTLFEEKTNKNVINDYDEAIKLFLANTENLNKTERLKAVLKDEIHNLEKQNKLNRLTTPPSEEMCFEDADIPYVYEQDKKVERAMRHFEKTDEITVDLHRVLYCSDKPVFSSIIYTVIFGKDDDISVTSSMNLSKKQKAAIYDVSKTQFLVDTVNLSVDEARYILMQCRFDTNEDLHTLFHSCENEIRNSIPELLGITKKELSYMLRSDQKLKSFGFIDGDGDYDSSLNECIESQSIEPYFSDLLNTLDCSNAYALDSFSVKQESLEICSDLLKGKNPVSILFYGKPGSGKTELAKSLCSQTGKQVYIFKNEAETNERGNVLSRLVCLLSMERKDSILIVDEADSLLKTMDFSFFGKTPSKTKGTVNKMLENNRDKVIYIINHQHQIDDSTRRRFTFSIHFEAMPKTMMKTIAEQKLKDMDLTENTKAELVSMLDKYHLTGQSVENIVKTIDAMECKDEDTLLKKADIVMKENSLLLNGKKKKMRDKVKAEYDLRVLNASMDPKEIVNMVQNAAKYAERNKNTENGIRMLFYGLSGTGKTELARYIAEQLGKEIILCRPSDILSPYVGQDEQNIRDAFEQAEQSDAILLFDEADTFFYDRNQAQRTWERSLVNEFLTQMEEFTGILICTTNLRNIMDPAMQRRFHMLVEFKPMKFDGIKIMLEKYFPDYHLSNKEIEELEDSDSVTPGDFGALSSRIRFMNPDDVDSAYILEELKKLQTEKKNQWHEEGNASTRKIGFAV